MDRADGPTEGGLSRRHLLAGLVGGAGLALSACTLRSPFPSPRRPGQCVSATALPRHGTVGGLPLHYEEDGRPRSFHFDAGFYRQLETWWQDWASTGVRGPFDRIDSYGAWTNGGTTCDSLHNSGRAFDVTALRRNGEVVVSCREDLWSVTPQAAEQRRGYWALAAHLHIHFAYVLTYLFDEAHRNHIHLDNARSGSALSTFRGDSRVQVQVVQATARWLFDEDIETTGRIDAATTRAARAVLRSGGRSGDLGDQQNWHAYLRAAVARAR